MNIDLACVECIINQSRRVAETIGTDAATSETLISTVEEMSREFLFTDSPPEVASGVYERMAEIAQKEDLYDEVKELSTQKAREFLPYLRREIASSDDKLLTSTKVAVAGNVIDLAAEVTFELDAELDKIFHTDFAHDDMDELRDALQEAKTLLYIGDNVGEHLFDYLHIETLLALYPGLEITYMVRGCPIINDVTMKEAVEAGFEELCSLQDSGVNTPGFVYERANKASRLLFDSSDLIMAKGMGNYECLSPTHRDRLLFLLKVKCEVVASSLQRSVGDIVCKMV